MELRTPSGLFEVVVERILSPHRAHGDPRNAVCLSDQVPTLSLSVDSTREVNSGAII